MKTIGSFLVNDARRAVRFGEVELIDPPLRERRGLQARPVKPYDEIYRSQSRPMKTTCVWDAGRIQ